MANGWTSPGCVSSCSPLLDIAAPLSPMSALITIMPCVQQHHECVSRVLMFSRLHCVSVLLLNRRRAISPEQLHIKCIAICMECISYAVLMDSLMGMCEWVSDSRESAWFANPRELRIRITDVLCPQRVGSAYGRAIHTISRRLVNRCRIRANPLGLRIHANCNSTSHH